MIAYHTTSNDITSQDITSNAILHQSMKEMTQKHEMTQTSSWAGWKVQAPLAWRA
jgi:hypothetical protein